MDAKRRLLIIEDDPYINESLQELMEMEGYQVSSAKNGKEGLDYLLKSESNELPHIIMLDLMMPIMDGFMFRQEQAKHEKISDIPVMVMTAHGNSEQLQDQVRAQAFIKKPLDINQILQVAEKLSDISMNNSVTLSASF